MTNALLPMPPFDWQHDAWEAFASRIDNSTLPHAFILAGRQGVGAESLVTAMGQLLLCRSPVGHIACGKCRACQLLDADTHPDLLRVAPSEAGKQVRVEQIRDVSSFVSKTAQQGGYKIIIITPAESMNVNAANALLKNLEEPTVDTVFFLVTHDLHRVLPTIRSRCVIVKLGLPDDAQSLSWLQSIGVECTSAMLEEAGRAPLRVRDWSKAGRFTERWELLGDLESVLEGGLEALVFAKKWSTSESPIDLVDPMIRSLDFTLAMLLGENPSAGHYQALVNQLSGRDPIRLFKARERLLEKKREILSSPNLNATLFIEALALDWAAILENT